jgi:hypothetical protein
MQHNDENGRLLIAPETVHRTREVLERAGYTDTRILEGFQVPDWLSLPPSRSHLPLLLHRTRGGTPLEVLLRLFYLGVPLEPEAVQRAIGPMSLQEWVAAGLVRFDGAAAAATVLIRPFRGQLVAFDRGTAGRRNRVMGLGPTSWTVANFTVRRHSRQTLDLCSGNGIHAVLAAPHSDRVVGVDCNPRAVHLATFNAQLNGLANVRFLEGDFVEPVQGQTFDLIVSNPPYVVSPEAESFITDSGLPGDQLCQKLIREVPPLLREGGCFQFQCEWAQLAGQDWKERLAGWFEGTGCDAWVIRFWTRDAATYASDWLRDIEADPGRPSVERFDRWLAYYERQRIEALDTGWISMRRASDRANWFRCDDAPAAAEVPGPCGDAILRGFERHDFLQTVRADGDLLNVRLRLSPDLRCEDSRQPAAGGWVQTASRLRLGGGLACPGEVNANVVALLSRCRGEHPLRTILGELATELGEDPERIVGPCLAVVRPLLEQGFLEPA